jgi:hypothetical protein
MVFENRVLRRIFGPKRDEVTGGWRSLHNEELHNLYSSPDIITMINSRRIELGGACSAHREMRNTAGKESIHTLCFFFVIPFNDLLENLF